MRVLIPVEDVFFGSAIVSFIAQHHWSDDTEFRIINVVDPYLLDRSNMAPMGILVENPVEQIMGPAQEIVDEVARALKKALPLVSVTQAVIKGPVKEQILSIARQWQADLVVAGSHGRSGFSRFILGSISLMLINESPCAVVLVKPNAQTLKCWDRMDLNASTMDAIAVCYPTEPGQARQKILLALDDTAISNEMIDFAIGQQWAQPAHFKLLSVVQPTRFTHVVHSATLANMREDYLKVRKSALRELAVKLREYYHSPNIEEELVEGDPKRTIIDVAKDWNADLVIVGCHRKDPLKQLFVGSVSLAVLCSAPCSVLLLRQAVPAKQEHDSSSAAQNTVTKEPTLQDSGKEQDRVSVGSGSK